MLNFNTFLYQLVKVKNLEKGEAFNIKQKHDIFFGKMVYGGIFVATIKTF